MQVEVAKEVIAGLRDKADGTLLVVALHDHQQVPGQSAESRLVLLLQQVPHLAEPKGRGEELLEVRGGVDVFS